MRIQKWKPYILRVIDMLLAVLALVAAKLW